MRNPANDIKYRGDIAVENIAVFRCTKVMRVINGQKVDITE